MTSEELRLVNAVFGFCVSVSGTWPRPLGDLGYVPCGVEREIKVILDGEDRTVVSDFMCASPDHHHVLCVEAKSRTVDGDQARKYDAITPTNLVNAALPPGVEPGRLAHDVAYVATKPNAEEIVWQLTEFGAPLAVVAGDERLFELVSGAISQPLLHRVFADGIGVEGNDWPHTFVPFSSRSSPGEMVPYLARGLAQLIIGGRDFGVDDLAALTVPH